MHSHTLRCTCSHTCAQMHIHRWVCTFTQLHPFFKMANYCCLKKNTSNSGKSRLIFYPDPGKLCPPSMDPTPAGSTVTAAPKSSAAQGLPHAQQCGQEPRTGPLLRPELTERQVATGAGSSVIYHRRGDTTASGQLSGCPLGPDRREPHGCCTAPTQPCPGPKKPQAPARPRNFCPQASSPRHSPGSQLQEAVTVGPPGAGRGKWEWAGCFPAAASEDTAAYRVPAPLRCVPDSVL